MKKFYQISGLIVIIGIILFIFGHAKGGNDDINNIHSGRTTNIGNSFNHDESSRKSHHVAAKKRTFNLDKFSKINIDAEEPNIQITKGNDFQVTISGPNVKKISAKVEDDQLTISDNNAYEDGTYQVNVTVPAIGSITEITGSCSEGNIHLADLSIADFDLQVEDGNISAENVTTHKANLDLADGDLKITNSTLTSGILNLSEGDLTVTNSQFKVKATLGDGDVRVNDSKLLADSSFNLSEGDFQMSRPPKASYQLSTSSEGELVFHGNNYHRHFVKKLRGTPLLKVSCGDGDILIN